MDMFLSNSKIFDAEKANKEYSAVWSCGDFDSKLELTDIVNDWNDNPLVAFPVIKYMGFTAQAAGNTIKDVYFAANKLYEAAAKEKGDWHFFIEAFDYNADTNSYEMITGS
mgnify:FL=1|tara:strand:- start:27 stop:359 length:333 start_codon:yes stop_codon:yes gene_type:complete